MNDIELLQLNFYYGSPVKDGPKEWYLLLDGEVNSSTTYFATKNLSTGVLKDWERGQDHADAFLSNVYMTALATSMHPISMKAKKGWYQRKSGSFCSNIFDITNFKTVMYDEKSKFPVVRKKKKKYTAQELYDTASIAKWPNGSHYYVKLANGEDVVDKDRRVKWNTFTGAHHATLEFLGLETYGNRERL